MQKLFISILLLTLSTTAWAQHIPIQGVFLSRVQKELRREKGDSLLVDYLKRHKLNTIAMYGAVSSSENKREKAQEFKNKVDSLSWDSLTWMAIADSPEGLRRMDSTKEDYQYGFLENEWWKWFWGYGLYRSQLFELEINPLKQEQVLYLGWLSNKPFKAKQQAFRIVEQADYLAIHVYMDEPSPGYVKERLQYIAEAAKLKGKKQKILFLFSLERKYSSQYFIRNTYQDGYWDFINKLNRNPELQEALKHLDFQGYLMFSYNRRHQ